MANLMLLHQLRRSIAACLCLAWLSSWAWGEPACRATVKKAVEISGGAVYLSDLLAPDACPLLAGRAARVSLGKAPLPGSARVLAGDDVRAGLERVARGERRLQEGIFEVPERVVVRAAARRASCGEIWAGLATGLKQQPGEVTCGGADRIASKVLLEPLRKSWDATLRSWNLVAGCRTPAECVPFLVRVPESPALGPGAEAANPAWRLRRAVSGLRPKHELVIRPGEGATLLWEERGIRLEIPVVCLDGGAKGETVRARVRGHGGRMLRAIVMDSGRLRAIS